MLLPYRAKNPPESFPAATIGLIGLNVVIFIATCNGLAIRPEVLAQWGLRGDHFDALHVLSAMFLHGSWLHLIGNMWFLYLFGFAVEGRMRTLRFLFVYLVAGVAGDVLHQLILGASHPTIPSLGASGAIMGVVGAAMIIFPHAKISVAYGWSFRWGVFDCPMWGVGLFYVGFDVLWALIGAQDGVGHFAHIGGAAAGAILSLVLRVQRDDETVSEAKATLADTKDHATLSRHELERLHSVNPTDHHLLLQWAYKSIHERGALDASCSQAFKSNFDALVAHGDVRTVCCVVQTLPPDQFTPRQVSQIATAAEKVGDFQGAFILFDRLMRDGRAQPADVEFAVFRLGMLSESAYQDRARALQYYDYILANWPMCAFAAQAKARIAVLRK